MITCPHCQSQEVNGALFCSECGAQLVFAEAQATQSVTRLPAVAAPTPAARPEVLPIPGPAKPPPGALLSLHMVETGQVLPLEGREEFTLGRVADGQPILPDVDLSSFDAYSQGVSRLHAALRIANQKVTVVDLDSSNGTRVNGQKISPNFDYPINHGDIIALGKLKIQVLFQRRLGAV